MTPVAKKDSDEAIVKEIDKGLEKAMTENKAAPAPGSTEAEQRAGKYVADPAPEKTTKSKYDRSGRIISGPDQEKK